MARTPMKRKVRDPGPSGQTKTNGFTADTREAAKRRDGGCVLRRYLPEHVCLGELEVHHRKLRRHRDHSLDNAASLCRSGHLYVHGNVAWSYGNGLLLRSTALVEPL